MMAKAAGWSALSFKHLASALVNSCSGSYNITVSRTSMQTLRGCGGVSEAAPLDVNEDRILGSSTGMYCLLSLFILEVFAHNCVSETVSLNQKDQKPHRK